MSKAHWSQFAKGVSMIALASGLAAVTGVSTAVAQGTEPLVVMSTFSPNENTGPAFAEAVRQYTEKTGVEVETLFSSPTQIFTAYETAVLAGQEPHVLIVNLYDRSLEWTKTGATLPVTDYFKEWGFDAFVNPQAVDEWTDAEGRLQAMPYRGFSWPVWYNMELLAKVGETEIPTTYDDLIALSDKLAAEGVTAVSIGGSDWSGEKFLLQLLQLTTSREEAATLMAKGGYCDSPDAMRGIEEFVRLRDAGVFPDDAEGLTVDNMNAAFFNSDVAIMPAGSWSFPAAPEEMIENIVLGGFPLPPNSTYDKPVAYRAFSASGFWMTAKSMDRLDDYRAFVEHMYSPEVVTMFVSASGMTPVRSDLPDLESALAEQPLLAQAISETPKRADFGVFPDFYVPGADTQALIRATSIAFAPNVPADEICSELDAVYN